MRPNRSPTAWLNAAKAMGTLTRLLTQELILGRQEPPQCRVPAFSREMTGMHLFLYRFTWIHLGTMNRVLGLFDRRLSSGTGKSMSPTFNEYWIHWSSTFPRDIHLGDVVCSRNPTNPPDGSGLVKRVMGVEGQSYTKRLFRDQVVVGTNHQCPNLTPR